MAPWRSNVISTSGCVVVRTGDVDESGAVTSSDVIDMVNYVFKSGPGPQPIVEAGDVNCSGDATPEDIIYMVNYIFRGGASPCDVCAIL